MTLSSTSARVLAVVLLLLCLGGGFVAGVIADRAYLIHHERVLPSGGLRFITRHIVHRLDRSLDLTDEQERKIQQILDQRRERALADWKGAHQRLHEEMLAANQEISALLTPEQKVKFERMHRHWSGRRPPKPD